ncbi:hypothetical protein PRI8871_01638 [Pseudoprimorskyibacter insulae]|uniref:AsmA domain-containing protein n=1 Tax=Pseudoprimorskyibacter insulae TaxID=1695997 RepID=A0A2R8AUV9_9RHOB|nr:AsmA family protein [Pseudoprimorskyibacter insulae]SPF79838.1 hypothetical protein PRI8871_01638 [Pseudoprimorskyibacter insulae]
MKFLFKLFGVLIVTSILVVIGILMLPADRLGAVISSQLTRQLGRDVALGEVSLSILPAPGVEVRNLKIANADWSDKGPMLEADRALVQVDLMAALQKEILIRAIEIDAPHILLEAKADGRANWQFGEAEASQSAPSDSPAASGSIGAITLERLAVKDAQIRYEQPGEKPILLRAVDLRLDWPDPQGPAQIEGKLTPYTGPITFDANISDPLALAASDVSPVTLSLATSGGKASFQGRAGTAPELAGAFDLNLSDTSAFAAALGVEGLDLPQGAGRKITAKGNATLTKTGEAALRGVALTVDANALQVDADVKLAAKPHVTAKITAGTLDLSTLLGGDAGSGGAAAGGASQDGWSRAPIDASALGLIDGTLSLAASALKLPGMSLGATKTVLSIDQSRAVFTIEDMQAYQGKITGQFVANNRNGLSVGGDLTVAEVALRPLLTETLDVSRFSGMGNLRLKFLGVGQSVDAIMRSLSGDATILAGPGVISGIDLDQLFSGGTGSGGTTVFDTLNASLTMSGGVARNSDLAMSLPRIKAKGEGVIDLGNRRLDYLFTAMDPQARDGRGFAIPLRIKGPWSGPTIRADAGELINQNFQEEKKKIESEVRDKVNDKLQETLGIRVEEGQKPEDVLKQKLEEEATKKIFELLKR